MAREWPSREEWQGRAEYAVRTSCTMFERLDRLQPGAVWLSMGEETELEELAGPAAAELKPLLTTEINRLRAKLPDRPAKTRARIDWFNALEGDAYEDACNLGSIEEMRREVERDRREGKWGAAVWHLGRIRKHYPSIVLPDSLVTAHDRIQVLLESADERRTAAARAAQQAAVDAEVAHRATDEAWAEELERRARIDSPRVIHYPA